VPSIHLRISTLWLINWIENTSKTVLLSQKPLFWNDMTCQITKTRCQLSWRKGRWTLITILIRHDIDYKWNVGLRKKNVMLPCRFLAKGRSCSGLRGLVAFRKPFRWAAVVFIEVWIDVLGTFSWAEKSRSAKKDVSTYPKVKTEYGTLIHFVDDVTGRKQIVT
jgi:hypothetical protein